MNVQSTALTCLAIKTKEPSNSRDYELNIVGSWISGQAWKSVPFFLTFFLCGSHSFLHPFFSVHILKLYITAFEGGTSAGWFTGGFLLCLSFMIGVEVQGHADTFLTRSPSDDCRFQHFLWQDVCAFVCMCRAPWPGPIARPHVNATSDSDFQEVSQPTLTSCRHDSVSVWLRACRKVGRKSPPSKRNCFTSYF